MSMSSDEIWDEYEATVDRIGRIYAKKQGKEIRKRRKLRMYWLL